MGQKVNPVGLRLGITRGWDSKWFAEKGYKDLLREDIAIRKFLTRKLPRAGISRAEIERAANRVKLTLHTAKPGIIIGRRGAGVDELRRDLERLTGKLLQINVQEIKQPELDAKLVAENVAEQLEKRVAFRRAMKQAVARSMRSGAKGIKVETGGRLAGAEIARSERTFEGKVPLHTLTADIDFATAEAYTTYGRIGIKVWIYRGDTMFPGMRSRGAESQHGSAVPRGSVEVQPAPSPVPVEVSQPVSRAEAEPSRGESVKATSAIQEKPPEQVTRRVAVREKAPSGEPEGKSTRAAAEKKPAAQQKGKAKTSRAKPGEGKLEAKAPGEGRKAKDADAKKGEVSKGSEG